MFCFDSTIADQINTLSLTDRKYLNGSIYCTSSQNQVKTLIKTTVCGRINNSGIRFRPDRLFLLKLRYKFKYLYNVGIRNLLFNMETCFLDFVLDSCYLESFCRSVKNTLITLNRYVYYTVILHMVLLKCNSNNKNIFLLPINHTVIHIINKTMNKRHT